ncbi:MAG: hypothetical protein H7328_03620 [Bdellovibrio sp.]|nr:hypothetical protein [Bdellovibrio sp.]
MKKTLLAIIAVVAFSATPAFAQAPTDHTQHDGHTPDSSAKQDMMGKMDMEHMQGMMKECMQTKKDDKMCDQDMMEMCHSKMNKSECNKMMKRAKAQNGTIKK